MKTIKNLTSCVAIAMIAMFSMTLVSCGGDEENDPKPTETKTDLQKVQENIVGVKVRTVSAEITVDGSVVEINDLCNPGAAYMNSVEDMTFEFTTSTSVHVKNECQGNETNLTYSIVQNGDIFYIQMKSSTGSLLVDAEFKKSDFVDSKGEVLPIFKGTLNEITTPKNWEMSPVVHFEIVQ